MFHSVESAAAGAAPTGRTASARVLLEILFIAATPLLCWVLLGIVLINQDQFIDPWFYTGYGRVFPLLHELFGWPYYAVRFPVIALNESFSVFGPLAGYALLRYVLLVACGIPLYLWSRHEYGRSVAAVSYLFLCSSPLLLRVLLWDLTTFVSVPMAMMGMALWLLPERRTTRFLSGFCWTASVASHAFTGTAIGTFVAVQILRRMRAREPRQLIVRDALPAALGSAVCFVLGCVYFYARIGRFDPTVIVTVTIDAVAAGHAYAGAHRTPFLVWGAREYHVYTALLCVVTSGLLLGRRVLENTALASVWWFGLAYSTVYVVYQFVMGRFVLETFYYFAHLTPVVFLLVPVTVDALTHRLSPRTGERTLAAAAGAVVLLPLLTRSVPTLAEAVRVLTYGKIEALFTLAIASAFLLAVARPARRRPGTAAAMVIGFLLLVQLCTFLSPPHWAVFESRRRAREVGVYQAAVDMLDVFAAYATRQTPVMLWYCPAERSLSSIASSVLLFTIHNPFSADPQACEGTLGEYERNRLATYSVQYVLMMDEGGESFPAREAALRREGYSLRPVRTEAIGNDDYTALVRVLEIAKGTR